MSKNFGIGELDLSIIEMRRKRDCKSLKRICDLCLELEREVIAFNDGQEYSLTPLFRADELVSNIRIVATIMAKGIGEINDLDNKQDKIELSNKGETK